MVIYPLHRHRYLTLFMILPLSICLNYLVTPPKASLPEPSAPLVQVELASSDDQNLVIKPVESDSQKVKKVAMHVLPYSKLYVGKIGNFPVTMSVEIADGEISGYYNYDKIKADITVKGSVVRDALYRWYEDNCSIKEFDRYGEQTGEFTGVLTDFEFFGTWSNGKRSYPFTLVAVDSIGVASAKLTRVVDDRYRSDMHDGVVSFPVIKLHNKKLEKLVREELQFETVFDPDMKGWLDSARYFVTYNKNNILNLVWWIEGSGAYPDQWYHTATVNLKTGKRLVVSDIFKKDRLKALAKRVDERMWSKIKEHISENVEEDNIDYVRDELQDRHFTADHISSFSVNGEGITFYYSFGFPHAAKACEPESDYFFSWDELSDYLKPDGLLGQYTNQHL